jgi:hypothetical protein
MVLYEKEKEGTRVMEVGEVLQDGDFFVTQKSGTIMMASNLGARVNRPFSYFRPL